MTKYLVDSDIMFHLETKYHFVEGMHNFIEQLYQEGRLVLIKKFVEEMHPDKEKHKNNWRCKFLEGKKIFDIKENDPEMVLAIKKVVESLSQEIVRDESQITKWSNSLDSWLVIYAYYLNFVKGERAYILTNEREDGKKLKIPYIAKINGLRCINFEEFLNSERKKLKLVSH